MGVAGATKKCKMNKLVWYIQLEKKCLIWTARNFRVLTLKDSVQVNITLLGVFTVATVGTPVLW